MPSFGEEGKGKIVLCSIEGFKTVSIDHSDLPSSKKDSQHTFSPCSYALLSHKDIIYTTNGVTHDLYHVAFHYGAFKGHIDAQSVSFAYHARGPPIIS